MAINEAGSRRKMGRRWWALCAATVPVVASCSVTRAGGIFDGEQTGGGAYLWSNPVNWDSNTLPAAGDAIVFGLDGIGGVDLGGSSHSHPSFTFSDWSFESLFSGSIASPAAGGSVFAGAEVESVYGSESFFPGTLIEGWDLGAGSNTLSFTGTKAGEVGIVSLTGTGSLTVTTGTVSPTRSLYFLSPGAGYSGTVNIKTGTAVHLMTTARPGAGIVSLQGGDLVINSDSAGGEVISNSINSAYGTIRAEHIAPGTPPYMPGIVHALVGGVTVDNPTNIGGTNVALINFTADNGFNFTVSTLTLSNTQVPAAAAGVRYVEVTNGVRTTGVLGSTRQTSANRLNEQVVTTTVGFPGVPSLFDFDPVSMGGLPLLKYGTGVLVIDGMNSVTSTGIKYAVEGVLRFNSPLSWGAAFTPIALGAGGGPVDGGVGVGFPSVVPPNVSTFGTIPGQSGAFDIDTFSPAAFAPAITSATAPFPLTALRLGSSGTGTISDPLSPFDNPVTATSTYYLGGGGGTLTMSGAWVPAAFPTPKFEMGTSGLLLPGRVNIVTPLPFGPALGKVNIRAGTLDASPVGVLAASAGTSVGAYSTTLSAGAVYGGAPAGTPYNGPGQLLLDATTQAGFGYAYAGAMFGATGVTLDGGAIGWGPTLGPAPAVYPVVGVPGTYGTTLASTLYQSLSTPLVPVATNILHFGGENSTGTMTVAFPITNNGATPVALLKSGVDSILDLRPLVHSYSGGTGIIGGEVQVDGGGELGGFFGGAVVIADGGILHVMSTGGPVLIFPQVLRVNNGSLARSSIVNVDPGVTAMFSIGKFEAAAPGSVLEKTGMGTLSILPAAVYPFASNQTTWGIKASEGTININQLPHSAAAGVTTGSVILDGSTGTFGTLKLVGLADPGFIAIPAATKYDPNYGFAGIQSLDGPAGILNIGDGAFFRITGTQQSTIAGGMSVMMAATSVLKIAGNAAGDDTRGDGGIVLLGGNVQFTPGGGHILWPRGLFSTALGSGVLFSGCPDADIYGALAFNVGASASVTIDAATVDNTPTAFPSTWTIGGTMSTSWTNTVIKGHTQAIPGGGGPFVSGTVNLNRDLGCAVTVNAGALLDIEFGTLNAGGTGDPFTDSSTALHLAVINNSIFNITSANKHIASLLGVGVTTVSAGARLDVGSIGPVTQSTFTVNGTADVGTVDVSGTTSTGPGGSLTATHVRGAALSLGTGSLVHLRATGLSPTSTSVLSSAPTIATGAQLDLEDNALIVNYGAETTNATRNAIRNLLINGRNAGPAAPAPWNGLGGITSSYAHANGNGFNLAIGYADNATLASINAAGSYTAFGGQTVASTTILVQMTRGADCNLDGNVDGSDVSIIGTHFNQPGSGQWYFGDFDYSGSCDGNDISVLGTTFGQSSPTLSPAELTAEFGSAFPTAFESGANASAVPEPANLFTIAISGIALTIRRRTRRATPKAPPD